MTVQEIEKLKKVDEIMFNLQNSTDPQKALLQAGEFLKGLNLIDDQTNIEGIIQTYTDNLHKQLAKIIQRKAVSFNWTTWNICENMPMKTVYKLKNISKNMH